MALGEQIRQLDEQVAAAVRRALDDVRDELRSGLEQAIGDLRDRLSEVSPELPESFFTEDALRQLAETTAPASEEAVGVARAEGRAAGSTDLREALVAIDRARSQKEILQALVDRSEPFASRAAVLLLRPEGLVGWTARGFGDAEPGIRSVSLPAQGDDWRDVIQDGPSRPLTASRCGQLVSQLESQVPTEGVAIPLILRDRVSAVVYADRVAADAPFDVAALQVLVYTTALALETLAFREREATATLLPEAEGAAAAAPPSEVAEPGETAPAEVEATPEPEPESETAGAEIPETPAEPPGPEPASEPSREETARRPTPELPSEADAAGAAETSFEVAPEVETPVDTPEIREAAPEEVQVEPSEAPEIEAPSDTYELETPEESPYLYEEPAPEPRESAGEPEIEIEDTSLESAPTLESAPAVEDTPALEADLDQEFEVELEDYEEPEVEEAPPDSVDHAADRAAQPGAATEAIPWRTEEPGAADAAGAAPTPAQDEPSPEEPPPSPETAPEAAEPESEEETPDAPPSVGPIEPPPDVEGPGLAFSGKKTEAVEPGDEAAHDEARRLARLLVSEIQLYNQEEVAEGRSRGDIYERLKDDIDRSRQLYEERVDPDIRESTDYFYQELVRQLGAGDAKALGI